MLQITIGLSFWDTLQVKRQEKLHENHIWLNIKSVGVDSAHSTQARKDKIQLQQLLNYNQISKDKVHLKYWVNPYLWKKNPLVRRKRHSYECKKWYSKCKKKWIKKLTSAAQSGSSIWGGTARLPDIAYGLSFLHNKRPQTWIFFWIGNEILKKITKKLAPRVNR